MKLTPSIEDYIKAVYSISKSNKVVRVKDLAKYLNVKMPSVVNAVKSMENKGLVVHENYGYIELTDLGKKVGRDLEERFNVLTEFLVQVLQLDKETATADACSIEHYLNHKTVDRIIELLRFLKSHPTESRWISKFEEFLSKNG